MYTTYKDFNEIGDKGMIQLLKVFKQHKGIKVIDLRNNRISNAMAQRITDWKNDVIKTINVSIK
jgi:hypothetical protein